MNSIRREENVCISSNKKEDSCSTPLGEVEKGAGATLEMKLAAVCP